MQQSPSQFNEVGGLQDTEPYSPIITNRERGHVRVAKKEYNFLSFQ